MIVEPENVLKSFWEDSQDLGHPAPEKRESRCGRGGEDPYRGIFPSVVVENSRPSWMPVGPLGDIIDLAADHQPLVAVLVVFLDLLPGVGVETSPGCIAFAIRLLLWGALGIPICSRLSVGLGHLTGAGLPPSSNTPIYPRLLLKRHGHWVVGVSCVGF